MAWFGVENSAFEPPNISWDWAFKGCSSTDPYQVLGGFGMFMVWWSDVEFLYAKLSWPLNPVAILRTQKHTIKKQVQTLPLEGPRIFL